MGLLPKKFFCWSLRAGTFIQGAICFVIAGFNIACVSFGLGHIMEKITYHFCWPSKECYEQFIGLENYLIHANIFINCLLLSLNILLLYGVSNEKPSHMVPFMIFQILTISGLAAASVTALVICFQDGSWPVFSIILSASCLYLSLHVYMALVNLAYYKELLQIRERKASICKSESGHKEVKELTLEDYVF